MATGDLNGKILFSPVHHACPLLVILQSTFAYLRKVYFLSLWQCPRSACRCNDPKTRVVPSTVSITRGDPTLCCEYSVRWAVACWHPSTCALPAASGSFLGLLYLCLCYGTLRPCALTIALAQNFAVQITQNWHCENKGYPSFYYFLRKQ